MVICHKEFLSKRVCSKFENNRKYQTVLTKETKYKKGKCYFD